MSTEEDTMAGLTREAAINSHIGGRIQYFRKRAGLSVQQLTALLNMSMLDQSRGSIRAIEAGEEMVTAARLVRIAEATGQPVQAFCADGSVSHDAD